MKRSSTPRSKLGREVPMMRSRSILLLAAALLAGASIVWARQTPAPNVPGMPTPARVTIINTETEPIPVVLRAAGGAQPVTVVGTAGVTMAPGTVVETRAARQAWEYRLVDLPSGQDAAAALDESGQDGWEAVGVVSAGGGASRVLLKRPR